MVSAGGAAKAMGDHEAAIGFYRRALQVAPKDVRVKAGLAGALVQSGDPYAAIPLFEQAEAGGAKIASLAADKGLAYDLVGDPASAQRYYRVVLANGENAEVRRRLAISQAISGDRKAMETTLAPLLQQQDKAAWRSRAFALAILGKIEESTKITDTILPKSIAQGISPFLSYMPRLTAGQQAAAANLGRFPRASEIGRDDPRNAQVARTAVSGARVATIDRSLIPQGTALGRAVATTESERAAKPEAKPAAKAPKTQRVAPPEPRPERTVLGEAGPTSPPAPAVPAASGSLPNASSAPSPTIVPRAASLAPAASAPATPAAVPQAPAQPAPAPREMGFSEPPRSVLGTGPAPGFDLATLPSAVLAASEGRRLPASSVAEAFGDLGLPVIEAAPASGAVDIRAIRPAKVEVPAKAEANAPGSKSGVKVQRGGKAQAAKAAPPKPVPPSHPSRIWVQIGVGQNKAAMEYDWRKLARKYPDVFRNRKANVSDMGRTNRMLIGPFASMKEANAFLAALKKVDIPGPHVWTSPAGQVVDAL